MLPDAAKALGEPYRSVGGWMTGALHAVINKEEHISITLVCPYKEDKFCTSKDFNLYTFKRSKKDVEYDASLKGRFAKIIKDCKPDVIHMWGSEFPHTLSMIEAAEECGLSHRTVIHIQGLMHIYEKHYYGDLPLWVRYGMSLRDMIKRSNVKKAKKEAYERGVIEKEALRRTYAVAGRTQWDEACSYLINNNVKYFHCREVLRDCFYEGQWNYSACNKHQIFFSQPIGYVKAFYQLLKVFPEILKEFPNAKIVTTGNIMPKNLKQKMMQSLFHRYLYKIIKRNNLVDHIEFRGNLTDVEMKDAYLKSNVFVSTSTIENSPNSLGEAMLLGMPCVTSDVGGTAQMLINRQEGFVYPFDEDYMLLWYILQIFKNPKSASEMGLCAKSHASETQSKNGFVSDIKNIYNELINR